MCIFEVSHPPKCWSGYNLLTTWADRNNTMQTTSSILKYNRTRNPTRTRTHTRNPTRTRNVVVYPLPWPLLVGGVRCSRLWSTSQLLRPSGQQCSHSGGVCPQIQGRQCGAYVGAVEEMIVYSPNYYIQIFQTQNNCPQ